MNIQLGKLLGEFGEGEWGMVHEFWPQDTEKQTTLGRLIIVVTIKGLTEPGVEISEVGKELLMRIHELYYGSAVGDSVVERLKYTLTEVSGEFLEAELSMCALVKSVVYLGVVGKSGIWVRNKSGEGWVVEPGKTSEIRTVSGWAQEGEVVVMGTGEFWNQVPLGAVKSAIDHAGIQMTTAIETLAALERSKEATGEAGVIVRIDKLETIDAMPVETIAEESVDLEAEEEQEEEADTIVMPKAARLKMPAFQLGEVAANVRSMFRKPTFAPDVYIDQEEVSKRQRKAMYLGMAFLVMFGILFGVGKVRNSEIQRVNSVENKKIELLVAQFDEAKSVASLNKTRSKELIAEIQSQLTQLSDEQKKDGRVKTIQNQMGAVLGEATGTLQTAPEEIVDLGLKREGVDVVGIQKTAEGQLLVLDQAGGRLFTVNPTSGSPDVLAGKADIGTGNAVAISELKIGVWGDKGLVECSFAGKQCGSKIAADSGLTVADMGYWGANLYALDTNAGVIWKYTGIDGGYAVKKDWVTDGGNKIGKASGMAIDGNIWVVGEGGIKKYIGGVLDSFSLSGVDKPFGEGAKLYTDEGMEMLYVLDRANSRIVEVAKTGEYQRQWVDEGLRQGKALVVLQNNIYVVGGTRVWRIKI